MDTCVRCWNRGLGHEVTHDVIRGHEGVLGEMEVVGGTDEATGAEVGGGVGEEGVKTGLAEAGEELLEVDALTGAEAAHDSFVVEVGV